MAIGAACGPSVVSSTSTTASAAKSAPSARVALPGACVDPLADARRRLGADADEKGVRVEPLDLDLDGVADAMLTHEAFCGTGGCKWELYVRRDACAHWVGELFAVLPLSQPGRHHGLVDLSAVVRNGCAGMARAELRVRFDGSTYVVDRMRTCRCPDDDDRVGDDVDPDRDCDAWHAPSKETKP